MIEFLESDAAPGPDEELAPTQRHDWLRRLWPPLLAVAVIVAVVVVVTSGSGSDRAPPPSTPPPSAVALAPIRFLDPGLQPANATVRVPSGGLQSLGALNGVPGVPSALATADRLPCKVQAACYVGVAVPDSVRAAVTSQLPGARITRVLTVLSQSGGDPAALWFRQVEAGVGDVHVVVRVLVPAEPGSDYFGSGRHGSATVRYSVAMAGQLAVVVQVVAPRDRAPAAEAVNRLAQDARLLVVDAIGG